MKVNEKPNSKSQSESSNKTEAEEIIAKELALRKAYSSSCLTKKDIVSHKISNKRKIVCYLIFMSIILSIVLSVAFFFFFSFFQSPKEDYNILTYKHHLQKAEEVKSRIAISVDSIVRIEMAKIDSSYRSKRFSQQDSLSHDLLDNQIVLKKHQGCINISNTVNSDSISIPTQYASRIDGLLLKHKVKRGETLRTIALLYYGSKKYSNFIFVYNRNCLSNPDYLKYGLVINIPKIKGINLKNKFGANR